jgi:hypothetical protein
VTEEVIRCFQELNEEEEENEESRSKRDSSAECEWLRRDKQISQKNFDIIAKLIMLVST